MDDDTEWTKGLGEGFREYFYGELGGDFPLDRVGVKFNEFEKRYITAVFREYSLYRFLTDCKNEERGNGEGYGEKWWIQLSLFWSFNCIGREFRGKPYLFDYKYNECPRHPIQEFITSNYPKWTHDSHLIIQQLIEKKLDEYYNKQTLPELMVAVASSLHKRLGQNSDISALSPEMLEMIRDSVIQNKIDRIDAKEFAYLKTLCPARY